MLRSEHRLADYDFDLPEELIAQEPARRRDEARLLLLDRSTGARQNSTFASLADHLEPGDLLVLNNTRVFPARLRGVRMPGGGAAEIVLVEEGEDDTWEAIARPGRRLKPGSMIEFGDGRLLAEVLDILPDGRRWLQLSSDEAVGDVIDALGEAPLPPYIRRPAGASTVDRERYQTVYARERGAVAAPTAGLHFTPRLLDAVRNRGVEVEEITLHVGYGTFEPVRVEDLNEHQVQPERFHIPERTARAIEHARRSGGRVIAVGTTTTRALESAADEQSSIQPGAGLADLTITPGYTFRVVDGLITNFHLPRSSLLVLVATFAGREHTLGAYQHAIAGGYLFYSYGDAMLIR